MINGNPLVDAVFIIVVAEKFDGKWPDFGSYIMIKMNYDKHRAHYNVSGWCALKGRHRGGHEWNEGRQINQSTPHQVRWEIGGIGALDYTDTKLINLFDIGLNPMFSMLALHFSCRSIIRICALPSSWLRYRHVAVRPYCTRTLIP